MILLHSTTSSSTVGAHPQHPVPLLHLNLMNRVPEWMVGHCPPTQNLIDNMLLQHYLCCLCTKLFGGFHILQVFNYARLVQTVRTWSDPHLRAVFLMPMLLIRGFSMIFLRV